MKTLNQMVLAAALLAAPSAAFAQTGSVGAVTVTLTLSFTAPGTVLKDETGKVVKPIDGGGPAYDNAWSIQKFINTPDGPVQTSQEDYTEHVSKIATAKFGNKEILLDMLAGGLLPTATIAGWSIFEVTESDGASFYVARHATAGNVPVEFAFGGGGAYAIARTTKTTMKETGMNTENPKTSSTESDTYNWKTNDSFTYGEYVLFGICAGSGKLSSISYKDPDTNEIFKEPVHVLGAQKLSGISGMGPANDADGSIAVIEGSVAIGAGKAVLDINTYLE